MKLYDCHNRPRVKRPLTVQDGWIEMGLHPSDSPTGKRERVSLPRMRLHAAPFDVSLCRYDKRAADPACKDCEHGKQ